MTMAPLNKNNNDTSNNSYNNGSANTSLEVESEDAEPGSSNSNNSNSSNNNNNNNTNNNINIVDSNNRQKNPNNTNNNINNCENEFKCPYCDFVYTSKNLLSNIEKFENKCEHLLLNYKTVSHLNATYRTASDLTGNLLGKNIPLVIAKRFIRYIRDQKTGQTGIYTIHQSKARISSTFQGITSFSLRTNDCNNKTTTIESNYYLTQNPIQDSTLFESFVLQNYIDSIPSLSTVLTKSGGNNNNGEMYIGFSKEQIQSFLEIEDQDANFSQGLDYENNTANNNLKTLLHRWILITGLPNNQLPSFVMLDSHKLDLTNDNLTLPIMVNDYQDQLNVNVYGIFPLPNIAIQS